MFDKAKQYIKEKINGTPEEQEQELKATTSRKDRRTADRAQKDLIGQLGCFYEFLSKSPQPSDEDVRRKFKYLNDRWIQYCRRNKFTKEAELAFATQVHAVWEKGKKKEQN